MPTPPPHNLPLQLSSFVGRERETAEVKALLNEARLVTLTGAGGSGKTRLAIEVALQLCADEASSHPYAAIWFIGIAPLTDPALVPQEIATTLGLRAPASESLTTTLTRYLRDQTVLLVFDNCEQIVEACAQLADALLRACPHAQILATSREALNIEGEMTYPVPPLSLPSPQLTTALLHAIGPETIIQQSAAVRLFVARATAAQPNFVLTTQQLPNAVQICRRLDGMPLAIELAAARVPSLGLERIAAHLNDALALLTTGKRTAPLRHQTLRATLDWSHRLLSEAECALFRNLSVFTDGWTLKAAEVLVQRPMSNVQNQEANTIRTSTLDTEHWTLDLLTQLVNKSLIITEDRQGNVRYRMLEPIRQYAHEQLRQAKTHDAFCTRHLNFFCQFAETGALQLRSFAQLQWLDALEAELGNFRTALRWACERQLLVEGLRLVVALTECWYRRGYWQEGRTWSEKLLTMTESSDRTALRARVLYAAAYFSSIQTDISTTRAKFEESLSIFREAGDQQGIADTLLGLGEEAIVQRRDPVAAHHYLHEGHVVSRAAGYTWGAAKALAFGGDVHARQGERERARAHYQESIDLYRQLGDEWMLVYPLSALGGDARNQEAYPKALAILTECVTISRRLNNQIMLARSLIGLGTVLLALGECKQACPVLTESMGLYRDLSFKIGVAESLNFLGTCAVLQGDRALAHTQLSDGLQLSQEIGFKSGMLYAQFWLGIRELVAGNYASALKSLTECLERYRALNSQADVARCLLCLGCVMAQQGDHVQAQAYLDEGAALCQALQWKSGIAQALFYRGWLAQSQGQYGQALTLFRESLARLDTLGMKRTLVECLEGVAEVAVAYEQYRPAAVLFGATTALRETTGLAIPAFLRDAYERHLAVARSKLKSATLKSAWSQGYALTLTEACAEAEFLNISPTAVPPPLPAVYPADLTEREVEVLRSLAQGLSDGEIAQQLILSPRTVQGHLRTIYEKLDVGSRMTAVRRARELKVIR